MTDAQAMDYVRETLLQVLRERSPTWEGGSDVGHLARELARAMGLPEARITPLFLAAELQSIGKVGVPDAVLNKPSSLTDEEWVVMRGHVDVAVRILRVVPQLEEAADIVYHVFEHWDGSGYPRGLAGDEIPVEARIIHACIAFHAMTVARPWRRGLDIDVALEQLRENAGSQFDPAVVGALVEMIQSMMVA